MTDSKLFRGIIKLGVFIELVIKQFIKHMCVSRAASLAYASLLSLVPLLTVSFSILNAFPFFQKISFTIQDFIFKHFVVASAETISDKIEAFLQQTSQLPITSLIFLLFTAILMLFNMEQAFNRIWEIKKRRNRFSAFFMYWGVLILTPLLIGLGILLSSYIFSIPFFTTIYLVGLKRYLLFILPFILTLCGFTLIYIAIPNCKVPFLSALIGGVVGTILFELAKFGFATYITHVPTYRLVYGTLATIPIFLVWIYISWLVILVGAVVSHVFTSRPSVK